MHTHARPCLLIHIRLVENVQRERERNEWSVAGELGLSVQFKKHLCNPEHDGENEGEKILLFIACQLHRTAISAYCPKKHPSKANMKFSSMEKEMKVQDHGQLPNLDSG